MINRRTSLLKETYNPQVTLPTGEGEGRVIVGPTGSVDVSPGVQEQFGGFVVTLSGGCVWTEGGNEREREGEGVMEEGWSVIWEEEQKKREGAG